MLLILIIFSKVVLNVETVILMSKNEQIHESNLNCLQSHFPLRGAHFVSYEVLQFRQ